MIIVRDTSPISSLFVIGKLGLRPHHQKYRVVYYLNFQDEVEIVTIRHSSKPLGETQLPFG